MGRKCSHTSGGEILKDVEVGGHATKTPELEAAQSVHHVSICFVCKKQRTTKIARAQKFYPSPELWKNQIETGALSCKWL